MEVANPHPDVGRRSLVGTDRTTSVLGFVVRASVVGAAEGEERVVATLRQARGRGVSTFQVPADPGAARAERWLGLAFPSPDPDLIVLLDRSRESLSPQAPEAELREPALLDERLRKSLEVSATRLGPNAGMLVHWVGDDAEPAAQGEVAAVLEGLRRDGRIVGWVQGLRADRAGPLEGIPDRATLFSCPLSLLDRRQIPALSERAAHFPTGVFATDPLSAGRLDGSAFAASVLDRRPAAGPAGVRELHREFDPVIRLGFLTERRQRTLLQAAIAFELRWPWVCAVLLPVPSPERMEELLGAERTPPISDAELSRIGEETS